MKTPSSGSEPRKSHLSLGVLLAREYDQAKQKSAPRGMFTTSDEKLVPECTYGSVNKRGENMTKLTPVRVPQDSPEPLRDIEDNYCNLRTVK